MPLLAEKKSGTGYALHFGPSEPAIILSNESNFKVNSGFFGSCSLAGETLSILFITLTRPV